MSARICPGHNSFIYAWISKLITQLLSLRRSAETVLGRLKVKVTFESQMIKCSEIELVQAIISTFMHVFRNNFALLFSLKSRSAI